MRNRFCRLQRLCGGALALLWPAFLGMGILPAQAATLGEIDVTKAPYSAKGDGVTDNTDAFQSALSAAASVGAIVRVPAGQYVFKGSLNIPAQVVLEGVNAGERTSGGYEGGTTTDPVANAGTVLLVTGGAGSANGTPFITLNANSGLRNVSFYYPNQVDPSSLSNWTPVVYPFTVSLAGKNGSIENISGVNPYQFIEAASSTGQSQRESIRRVNGTPLFMGVLIDNNGDGSGNCADTLDDIHFVPSFGNGTATTWIENHATFIQVNHADEIVLRNCFCFEYGIGLHFGASSSGSASGTIVDCGVDSSVVGVQIDSVQRNAGGLVFEGGGYSASQNAVNIASSNSGNVTFNGSHFWGGRGGLVTNAALKGSVVSFLGCYFLDWDYAVDATGNLDVPNYGNIQTEPLNPNIACIVCGDQNNPGVASGKTRVVNCQFKHNQIQYTYTPGEAAVLFEGNNVPHGVRTQGIHPTATGPNYIQVNNF